MKIVPKLKKGKKLLKGEEGTPVVISRSEYTMTPEGQFILLDLNGKWLFFDDMATRDSLAYQWYPYEDIAPASAFSNGVPNRKDPYYLKAQEQAKLQKKANKSEKKEKGGIMKGQGDLDTSNIDLSGIDFSGILEKARKKLNPKLIEIQERISPSSINMLTTRDKMEMPKYLPENQRVDAANINRLLIYKASERKLLPKNVGKYGLFSKRRTLLNNQSEIQPITSGEELIRNMPIGYNTAPKLKKGGIVKGQDDIKISQREKKEKTNRLLGWINPIEVSKGFTLSDYAKIYGLSLDELLKFNPQIKDKDKIIAGLTINIPVDESIYNPGEIVELDNSYDHGSFIYAKHTWFDNNRPFHNQTFERLPGGKYFLSPFFEYKHIPKNEIALDAVFYRKNNPDIPYEDLYKLAEEAERSGKYMSDLIDDYRDKKYGKEEQEFLRNNQLDLVPHELLTYHDIPNTREGLLILDNINKIDKDILLPGYSIHSYVGHGGYPVSIVRDNKGNRVFVLGNEDRLIPKTTLYIVRIGSDYSDPNYLLSLPGVSYKLR